MTQQPGKNKGAPGVAAGARVHGKRAKHRQTPSVTLATPSVTVWRFVARWRLTHGGLSPTVRDIQHGCGMSSTSVAAYHLGKLEQAGVLARVHGRARAMQLCEPPPEALYHVRLLTHDAGDWELLTDKPVPFDEALAVIHCESVIWQSPRNIFFGAVGSFDFQVRTHSDNRFVAAVELVEVGDSAQVSP